MSLFVTALVYIHAVHLGCTYIENKFVTEHFTFTAMCWVRPVIFFPLRTLSTSCCLFLCSSSSSCLLCPSNLSLVSSSLRRCSSSRRRMFSSRLRCCICRHNDQWHTHVESQISPFHYCVHMYMYDVQGIAKSTTECNVLLLEYAAHVGKGLRRQYA